MFCKDLNVRDIGYDRQAQNDRLQYSNILKIRMLRITLSYGNAKGFQELSIRAKRVL